jgi:hypothetical protein
MPGDFVFSWTVSHFAVAFNEPVFYQLLDIAARYTTPE